MRGLLKQRGAWLSPTFRRSLQLLMRLTRMASATEMLSTAVVATNSNSNREPTVVMAASGSLDINHKVLKTKILNRKSSLSPRHFSVQAVKTNKRAALVTASIVVNSATTIGTAAMQSNRTDRNRMANVTTTETKTSNSLTKSQQSRTTITQLLMIT